MQDEWEGEGGKQISEAGIGYAGLAYTPRHCTMALPEWSRPETTAEKGKSMYGRTLFSAGFCLSGQGPRAIDSCLSMTECSDRHCLSRYIFAELCHCNANRKDFQCRWTTACHVDCVQRSGTRSSSDGRSVLPDTGRTKAESGDEWQSITQMHDTAGMHVGMRMGLRLTVAEFVCEKETDDGRRAVARRGGIWRPHLHRACRIGLIIIPTTDPMVVTSRPPSYRRLGSAS